MGSTGIGNAHRSVLKEIGAMADDSISEQPSLAAAGPYDGGLSP